MSERKTNFAIAMSAAASIPCPVTSPSATARRPSGEREEVIDVAADVDPRGGLVDRADSSPCSRGSRRGSSDRCIVSEKLFCCWYSRALSIASAAWPAIESAVSTTSPRSGRAGSSETSVSVASASVGVETGMTTAVAPRSRKGTSSSCPASWAAERRSSTIGSLERSSRRTGGAVTGWSRRGSSGVPRASGSETCTE